MEDITKLWDIFQAVHQRNNELLKTLLNGVDSSLVNIKYKCKTLLGLTVSNGDLEATTLLLDHGAVPDYQRNEYEKFIDNRVYHQSDSIDFKSLLNCSSIPELYRVECRWAPNTLLRAIQAGNRDVIKLLIDRGCDPDISLEKYTHHHSIPYNCWWKIIESNDLFMFKYLVECTGREVGENQWSQSMFLTACATGSDEIIIYLLDKGVPIDTRNQVFSQTGAYKALLGRHTDTFTELVDRGANLHITDENGLSLLHIAVHLQNLEPLRLLLERGLPVDCRDNHNCTPLHYAVRSDEFTNAMKILISRGADTNAVDNSGRTPLLTALKLNESELIIYLLFNQKNIDLDKRDNKGLAAMHRLMMRPNCNKYLVTSMLILPKINVNIRDNNNKTPLHYAIMNKYNPNIICALVDLGTDTGAIRDCREKLRENLMSLDVLAELKIKREIAGFGSDANIDLVFSELHFEFFSRDEYDYHLSKFVEIIMKMKNTKLLGRLTYFDFLHAKRRACIAVAKRPEMRKIFLIDKHDDFHFYFCALAKSYNNGLKPLTEEENDAITLVEDNLNVVFNGCLPNLVIHQIKKYIEIEDMVTVQKIVIGL